MKKNSSHKKNLLFALLAWTALMLSLVSMVHAADAGTPIPDYFDGGCRIVAVNLYATDSDWNLVKDKAGKLIPNTVTITLGVLADNAPIFPQPVGLTGLKFPLNETIWSITIPSNLTYHSCVMDQDPIAGLYDLKCTFTVMHPGTQKLRVTSERNPNFKDGSITDESDSVAYTMTIIVNDNSPEPVSSPK